LFANFLFYDKEWNYPAPYGLGRSEHDQPGLYMCCPTPPVSVEECKAGTILHTDYVKLIHEKCPTAYAYSYDDDYGLHSCPNDVNYKVTFCP
jgi:Thaumatin family